MAPDQISIAGVRLRSSLAEPKLGRPRSGRVYKVPFLRRIEPVNSKPGGAATAFGEALDKSRVAERYSFSRRSVTW